MSENTADDLPVLCRADRNISKKYNAQLQFSTFSIPDVVLNSRGVKTPPLTSHEGKEF